ncbi:MAG TPA: protein phosphatase 2C domain-containing protein [Bryobacteraceae bacterium]|jgi:serine/threonine protein phosphatase PrpC|nr:protein phosphatase 2C domain-containing protein [Bryobacteraceae bacterium]
MLEAFGLSDPGCVRQNNEDCYLISPKDHVYIVADGMGGAQAGEHASKLAVDTVAAVIQSASLPDAETLFQAFREANLRVMKAAAGDPELEGMGTTLLAALESGPELLIASVGDSRAYVYNGGELTGITEDQTWVNEVGRKLGIEEASLKTHPMRHVLTMAIGVSPELRVHSYTVRPQSGALILLSSDGLHGVIEAGVIADRLSGNGSLQAKCERLIEAAKQAGGPDNITVVLLQAK